VVAGEISSLAERSGQTAGEISRLVKQIQKVITSGGDSSRVVERAFERLKGDLAGYSRFVDGLELNVREQMAAHGEVSGSLGKIRSVTSENSLAAEKVKQVVGELKREVVKLKALLADKLVEASTQTAVQPQRTGDA
jgi:methyl-accepting chemotaxis protein